MTADNQKKMTPAEAVAANILRQSEETLVSSVERVGSGGFGEIFELTLHNSTCEYEGHYWKNPVIVTNVVILKSIG